MHGKLHQKLYFKTVYLTGKVTVPLIMAACAIALSLGTFLATFIYCISVLRAGELIAEGAILVDVWLREHWDEKLAAQVNSRLLGK